MELYLRWLAKYEQEEGENPPLGILSVPLKNMNKLNYAD